MSITLLESAFHAVTYHLPLLHLNPVFLIDAKISLRIRYNTIADIAIHSPKEILPLLITDSFK
jgi:hypothetical protein